MDKQLKETLEKQGHRFIGDNAVVKICRWTKNSLTGKGSCYKQKFYGIKSHLCCQMSPFLGCQNQCLHCWRPIEIDFGKSCKTKDNPLEMISNSIDEQRKLLTGFKGNSETDLIKLKQSQEPMQFAISLIGEPTLYPKLGELIHELRKKSKSTFIVTNGLCPEILKQLQKNKQLPTQLYISINTPNKKMFDQWHKSTLKNAWEKFNETLTLFPKLKTRKVIRMTLVKDLNMKPEHIEQYAKLIKKAKPDFIEIKGYMSVGFARKRLDYDKMPNFVEIKNYAEKISKKLKYKILSQHVRSNVVLIGKDKDKMKIKKSEI